MAGLFLLMMAMFMFFGLARVTLDMYIHGNLKWDRAISREAKTIAGNGMLLAIAGSFFAFGLDMVMSIWPYWAAAAIVVWLGFRGLDWLFIHREDGPRVIQHANGRRAIVDQNRYRPLPPPSPRSRNAGSGVGGGASDNAAWQRQSQPMIDDPQQTRR